MVAATAATSRIIDKSIATAMMGFMFPMYSIPVLSLGLVVGAVISSRLPAVPRRVAIVAAILLACGGWTLVRTTYIGDAARFGLALSKTHEEQLVARVRLSRLHPLRLR